MPFVYVVTKSGRCDDCLLPDFDDLHYTQAGSIYQCDTCNYYYEFKIGRRNKPYWARIDEEDVEKIIKPKKKKNRDTFEGEAYCVKCKDKRYFIGTIKTADSGRRMAQGTCHECGTKLNRILGKA